MATRGASGRDTGGLTDDAFLGDGLSILQPERGYRAGLDAVVLAAAVPIPTSAAGGMVRVLDVGAGVGVVGLCLARRVAHVHVTLVEREPDLAALARENVQRNSLSDRVQVVEADVTAPLSACAVLKVLAETFDIVASNPPYHDAEAGTPAYHRHKAASHAMPGGTLERWLRFMASMTRPGGAIAVIHRSEALDQLLQASTRRFGAIRIQPLHPRQEEPANRIVMTAIRGSRAPLTIAPGRVIHQRDGRFTAELEAVLRHGAALG